MNDLELSVLSITAGIALPLIGVYPVAAAIEGVKSLYQYVISPDSNTFGQLFRENWQRDMEARPIAK
jgi:hypothetical protein